MGEDSSEREIIPPRVGMDHSEGEARGQVTASGTIWSQAKEKRTGAHSYGSLTSRTSKVLMWLPHFFQVTSTPETPPWLQITRHRRASPSPSTPRWVPGWREGPSVS